MLLYRTFDNFCFCPDLHELGRWLQVGRPLLIEGNLFYSPHFDYEGPVDEKRRPLVSSFTSLRDALIVNRRVLDRLSKKSLKAGLVKPILQLELPILEQVDLSTFAKITVDENELLANFRTFLHRQLLGIDASRGSNGYKADLDKLSLDIADAVRRLDSETQKMSLKGWFQATGAVVATCTALLIALDQPTLASFASVGGGGGALWLVTKAMEEILSRQRDLKDLPVFYMWLLSKSAPRR